MKEAFLVDGLRTPIGKYAGSLSSVRTDTLAALPLKELRQKFPSLPIDDVILGCANQAGEDNRNIARTASLLAGLPVEVPGITVNRLCASGLSAILSAAQAIARGDGDIYIAGGVEHMTRAPYVMAKSENAFQRTPEIFDSTLGWRFINPEFKRQWGTDSMGETAENVAKKYSIERADQDAFALGSQEKAAHAIAQGRLQKEIVRVGLKEGYFELDEFPRADSSLEKLSKLKPAFDTQSGSVTAGNSSGINDGAAALLIASAEAVSKFGLTPLARIGSSAFVGVEPRYMGMGPVPASSLALKRAGLSLKQLSVIEINEAFAAQCVACLRELGLNEKDSRVNPNGGAIALGHPLGMTGARLALTAALELQARQEQYALVTMCVGVGQGAALVLERA